MRFMPSVPEFKRFQNIISDLANEALWLRFDAKANCYRFFFVSRDDLTDIFVRNEVFRFGGIFDFVYRFVFDDLELFSTGDVHEFFSSPSQSCALEVPLVPNIARFWGSESLVNFPLYTCRKKR